MPERLFYYNYRPYYIGTAVFLTLLVVLFSVQESPVLRDWAALLLVVASFFPLMKYVRVKFPYGVSEKGCSVFDNLGRRLILQWDEIDKVAPSFRSILLIRKGQPLVSGVLPTTLEEFASFEDAVAELAPRGNPMHDWAETQIAKRKR